MSTVQPPQGWKRIVWRLPIWLYRARLGRLLGGRFLLLTHTGRKSGLPRYAVVEVMRHDPVTNTYYVASGFGEKSDWFRNIMKTPQVTIQVGRRQMPAIAERLSLEDAERELLDYARRHPRALRNLARILGYRIENTEEDIRALAQMVPIVAFRVREQSKEQGTGGT
ncbi:MAG: nitroreductase family deazaflavin-dependent oxidoreductase [Chloroflexi bacterium]|nr:MAG: nitroreductase family deazaflavin-dependent oxidoreductase [Chloroflexota bacterium]